MVTRERLDEIHAAIGVPKDKGCIMLSTETITVRSVIPADSLYYAQDKDNFKYVNGIVSESVPHVTLLFGLTGSGQDWKEYIDELLADAELDNVTIDHVDYFESQVETEPYYCIVAHIRLTEQLQYAHNQLCRGLPHVTDFPEYKPHITLAYIKKDEQLRDEYIVELNSRLAGTVLRGKGLNYGD